MHRVFSRKSIAVTTPVLYLLGEEFGNRLRIINGLATECRSSIGLTQTALKALESSGAVRIERHGCSGGYLVETNSEASLTHVNIDNIVYVIPLSCARLYKGPASGLKAQFDGTSPYYAHVHGTDIRVEYLPNSVYNMAIVLWLAAESYPTRKGLRLALELGPYICIGGYRLICR